MKLDVAVNEAVLSNVGTTGEFRIRNSAKAFKILSDGLYSNKIRAIIRELSCNAVDSHIAAGKQDVPFEVHLPTILEPWFAVRDFGIGLNGDQIVNIYTTYFESTKTDSNAFIGALGLGSKSPFSYTENFTVTAIKDGVRRIYSAFINEVGVPSIAEMSEELTDEGNGVEVKFSVTDRYDYHSFRNEAQEVFMWFKNKPNIIGVDSFNHTNPDIKERDIVPGVHLKKDEYHSYSTAVMGNICYPLAKMPEPQKHLGSLASLLECGLILEFDIGDLDFAASREELSYVPLTLNSIRRKLEQLNANLAIHLAAKADAIEHEWHRAQYLYEQHATRLYAAAVEKYVADTKFPLYDPKGYNGKKEFVYTVPDLLTRGLDIKAFRVQHGTSNRIGEGSTYINNNYTKTMSIPVENDVVIVLNDLKTGCLARSRYHFSNHHNSRATVFCISHNDADLAVRQVEYDKIVKELHNPPVVIKASTLEKQVRAKAMSTQGIMKLRLKHNHRSGRSDSYTWEPYNEELDDNVMYYYVTLSNHQAIDDRAQTIDIFNIKALMDGCGVANITGIEILGVRKNRIKELKDLDNWIWFEEKLKEETAKITDAHISSLVAAEVLDSYYNRVYTNANVAKLVGTDSYYNQYVTKTVGIKRANGNVTELVALCGKYGKALQVDKVKKEIEEGKTLLLQKYPMLKYISHNVNERDVADYIKLVDKQEKVNE